MRLKFLKLHFPRLIDTKYREKDVEDLKCQEKGIDNAMIILDDKNSLDDSFLDKDLNIESIHFNNEEFNEDSISNIQNDVDQFNKSFEFG